MVVKRILVLANSIKKHARCVAGVEVESGRDPISNWVRPVSGESQGELEPRHMRITGAWDVAVLDIVDVPVVRRAADPVHPEDWVVDTGRTWTYVQSMPGGIVRALEETPADLWLEEPAHSDRVSGAFLLKRLPRQSLYLVRPEGLRIELTVEHNAFKNKDQRKTRARFGYNGHEYHMGVTDPIFTHRFCSAYPAVGAAATIVRPPYGDRCLLCVSLTPEFNRYHYKVVATILEAP